jgi:hypothetical protein
LRGTKKIKKSNDVLAKHKAQIPAKELRKGVKSKTKGEEEKDHEREVLQNQTCY